MENNLLKAIILIAIGYLSLIMYNSYKLSKEGKIKKKPKKITDNLENQDYSTDPSEVRTFK